MALTGDATTQASIERVRGLKRGVSVMSGLLGPNSVQLVGVRYLDWTAKTAEASMREFLQSGPHIDALWAANDPMALGAIAALVGHWRKNEQTGRLEWHWSLEPVSDEAPPCPHGRCAQDIGAQRKADELSDLSLQTAA